MTQKSWPYVNQAVTDVEYTLLAREQAVSGVVGTLGDSQLKVQGTSQGLTTTLQPGYAVIRGHMYQNTDPVQVTHDAANSSPRIDRVVLRLDLSQPAGSRISLAVIKGTPAATPQVPSLGIENSTRSDLPLARVNIRANTTGIVAADVVDDRHYVNSAGVGQWTTQTRPVSPRYGTLGLNSTLAVWEWWTGSKWESVFSLAQIPSLDTSRVPSLDASKVTTGVFNLARIPTLDAGRVPGLDASKIVSGTLNLARIPSLDAGRIPGLDASKIVSGTLNLARIPNFDASKITSGTLNTSRLPSNIRAHTVMNYSGSAFLDIETSEATLWSSGWQASLSSSTGRWICQGSQEYTVSASANVNITSSGAFCRSASSLRYKAKVEDAKPMPRLLEIQPRTWVDKREEDNPDAERHFGAIAEELDDLSLRDLVVYDEEGRPEAISYDRIGVALIPVVRELKGEVEELKAELIALKNLITGRTDA